MKNLTYSKLFYKIGEVAEMVDLEPYVLRYWEGEFNLRLTKSKNNQRLYQKKDIELIRRIKTLLYDEKYTIAGAKKKLRERKKQAKADDERDDPPLRSDAGVRPRDVDDGKKSLEDKLKSGFMAAYHQRVGLTTGEPVQTN